MKHYIITFGSTHSAMKAEKLLNNRGIKHEIIPTPKDISSDCGISVRVDAESTDIKAIKGVLLSGGISFFVTGREGL